MTELATNQAGIGSLQQAKAVASRVAVADANLLTMPAHLLLLY
jgi:hypothetical protein